MAPTPPLVQGEQLTYQQDEQSIQVTVGSAGWFGWLETATSFTYRSEHGTFTARLERASNKRGGTYWHAYRKRAGKLHRVYLGKSGELALERLQLAAVLLTGQGPVEETALKQAHGPGATPPLKAVESSKQHDPLLATKLHQPRPRAHLVSRSRLVERLQRGMEHALTLVSAPAGFGKTTLLSQWLAESNMPVAWLSLAPEDNDPVRFLSYLIAALQTVNALPGSPGSW